MKRYHEAVTSALQRSNLSSFRPPYSVIVFFYSPDTAFLGISVLGARFLSYCIAFRLRTSGGFFTFTVRFIETANVHISIDNKETISAWLTDSPCHLFLS